MFILGHVGIGSRLGALVPGAGAAKVAPWLLFGTLLPDLIDKPLYYGLAFASDARGADLGLISCTRTIGHSALFAVFLWLVLAATGRRRAGLALFVGMATHWLLDFGGDAAGFLFFRAGLAWRPLGWSSLRALVFPLAGRHFAVMPFHTMKDHIRGLGQIYTITGELVGGALLLMSRRSARMLPPDEATKTNDPHPDGLPPAEPFAKSPR
jgi:hypothetical protein